MNDKNNNQNTTYGKKNKKQTNYHNDVNTNSYNWHNDEMSNNTEIGTLAENVNRNAYYGGHKTKRLVEIGEELIEDKRNKNKPL